MLEDKQKEVDDNHRLIAELREDRDHYKQGYVEFATSSTNSEGVPRLPQRDGGAAHTDEARHRPQRTAAGVCALFCADGRTALRARNHLASGRHREYHRHEQY